jgi:hypothetical protein
MTCSDECLRTLLAVAEIDDPALLPLSSAALAAYDAGTAADAGERAKRLRALDLDFTRLSEPTFSALLIAHDIAARIGRLRAIEAERAEAQPRAGKRSVR